MAQFSHLKQQMMQQTHSVNNYQEYRQTSSENYPSSFGDMSGGSAVHQSVAGFGLENDQLGMQHLADHHHHHYLLNQQLHFNAPPPQQGYQSPQQTSQPYQEKHLPNHQHNTLQHSHLQHYQQQQREFQYQNPVLQPNSSNSQEQSLPVKQQIQQQSQQQQRPPQQLQPKRILQNPLHALKTVSSVSQQPTYQPSPQTRQPVTTQTAEDVTKNSNKVDDKPANNGLHQENNTNVSEKSNLEKNKEKTPLCLINELAHFNKLYQQFVLVDEQGPAHKKTFHVKLKLAEEEYSASGESIKKAQNAVATIALKETKYPHPQPKQSRNNTGSKNSLTAELRTLALKRGEAVVYKTIEPQQSPFYRQPGADFRRLYSMRYYEYMHSSIDPYQHRNGGTWSHKPQYAPSNHTFYVCICVGQREFIAEGVTRQEARHNAEQKALGILKNLPVQNEVKKEPELTSEEIEAADSLKSEISLVHEIALRRGMTVNFEVTHEAGLPHTKSFITRCSVGDLVTEGGGNSKKISKKKAAELMLEELKKLPGVCPPNIPRPRVKFPNTRKKNQKLVKSELQQQKADPNYGGDINPISRLIQLTQAKKRKDPVYTLISEKGLPMREFVIQVDVEDKTCTGTGPNKKLAKRAAAEAMLQVLGCTKPDPPPIKSALKHSLSLEGNQSVDKRVKFLESSTCKTTNTQQVLQQRVPGLLHLPSGSIKSCLSSGVSIASSHPKESRVHHSQNQHPQGQLDDLCESFNYEMKISDFSGKREQGMEHVTQITAGREQKSFHGNSNFMNVSRATVGGEGCLDARVRSINICGDGTQVKNELTTTSNASSVNISS